MTNQTVQVQYLDRRQEKFAPSLPITIDPTAGDRTDTPGDLFVGNWNGVMANRFFATAQYSRKTNHPRFGNTSTRLQDSPFLTIGRVSPGGLHFGPVYFDRTDPEDRDNNQLTGSVSYFGSKPGMGHARRQGRRRDVLARAARRQLAVVHGLPVQHRLRVHAPAVRSPTPAAA